MESSFVLPPFDDIETLPRKVYYSLQKAILNGNIKPGGRLIEDELSKMLKVSRAPIREAFRLLEKDGFIKIVPRKGAIVQSISKEDISDIYEIRTVLEGLAAKLFCERSTDEDLNKLQMIYKNMETALKNNRIQKYRKLNREFHEIFINGSNNKKVKEIYENFRKQIDWFQRVTLSSVRRPVISLKEHKKILEAFLRNDPRRAEREARQHVEHAARIYLETI